MQLIRMYVDRLKKRKGTQGLIKVLDSFSFAISNEAEKALQKLDKLAVDDLIYALNNEKIKPGCREKIYNLLGRIRDERAVDPLIESLIDKNSPYRSSIVRALAKIGGEKTFGALVKTLEEGDMFLRSDLAEILGNTGNTGFIEPLIKSLEHCMIVILRRPCRRPSCVKSQLKH